MSYAHDSNNTQANAQSEICQNWITAMLFYNTIRSYM
jgi:hypothetical protein